MLSGEIALKNNHYFYNNILRVVLSLNATLDAKYMYCLRETTLFSIFLPFGAVYLGC